MNVISVNQVKIVVMMILINEIIKFKNFIVTS